jgi:hypothetical protein
VGSRLQLLQVELLQVRSQINLSKEKTWWKIGQNSTQNFSRIQTRYIHPTNTIKTLIMSLKVLISKDLNQEVHHQISSKLNIKKVQNINMGNSQYSLMKLKISCNKIKNLLKIVKKYLRTTKKHRKCWVKHKMGYNRLVFKSNNPLYKPRIQLIIIKMPFKKCN